MGAEGFEPSSQTSKAWMLTTIPRPLKCLWQELHPRLKAENQLPTFKFDLSMFCACYYTTEANIYAPGGI